MKRTLVFLAAALFLSCSPSAPPSLAGTWSLETNGMRWSWDFGPEGDFVWHILGQTDMGGHPVEVTGKGSYSLERMALHLRFERFPGLPGGMWRSGDAAPGFDARTEARLRVEGTEAMTWSFSSATLGEQVLRLTRAAAKPKG